MENIFFKGNWEEVRIFKRMIYERGTELEYGKFRRGLVSLVNRVRYLELMLFWGGFYWEFIIWLFLVLFF